MEHISYERIPDSIKKNRHFRIEPPTKIKLKFVSKRVDTCSELKRMMNFTYKQVTLLSLYGFSPGGP